MTDLMEKAIGELTQLPENQQDTMAKWILEMLQDEQQWDAAFARSLPQLERMANKALDDFQAGRTHELDPDTLD